MKLVREYMGLIILCALGLFVGGKASADVFSNAVSAHVEKMSSLYKKGDLVGAISEIRAALELQPGNTDLHFMLGNALYRVGDLRGAADAYAITTDLHERHFEAHMSYAFSLYYLGDLANAETHWLSAMRLEPSSPFARTALAVALFDRGNVEDAQTQYEYALALDEKFADFRNLEMDIRWKPRSLMIVKKLLHLVLDSALLN